MRSRLLGPVGCFALWLLALPFSSLAQIDPQGGQLGAVAGRVRGLSGEPLLGALVVIHSLETDRRYEVLTEADGRFYHGGLRPGRYQVSVLAGGRVLWSRPVKVASPDPLPLEINLREAQEEENRRRRLDPALERAREEEARRLEREEALRAPYERGATLLQEKRYQEAYDALEAARALQPERALTLALLAAAAEQLQRWEEAEEYYRRAAALEPKDPAHPNNLAALLARRGRLEEALPLWEKAEQVDSRGRATFRFNRGAALLNGGRASEAAVLLREAALADPGNAGAQFFFGVALVRGSGEAGPAAAEKAEAVEAFRRYLQLAPEGPHRESALGTLKQLGAPPPPAAALPQP